MSRIVCKTSSVFTLHVCTNHDVTAFWASWRTQYLQCALWNCTSGHIRWTLLQSFTPANSATKLHPLQTLQNLSLAYWTEASFSDIMSMYWYVCILQKVCRGKRSVLSVALPRGCLRSPLQWGGDGTTALEPGTWHAQPTQRQMFQLMHT